MPEENDIYRRAKLLIDQHGDDATMFAAMQADKRMEAGNLDRCAVWKRVTQEVKELLNQDPRGESTT